MEQATPTQDEATNPTPTPVRSAEYMEQYETIYAEQLAEGKSAQVADFYATTYADQREKGWTHELATQYAEHYAEGFSHRMELYETIYAEQRAEGKSAQVADLYATAYADGREKGWDHESATDYAELRANGKSHKYAEHYVGLRAEGHSHEDATNYLSQYYEGKSHRYAMSYANRRAEGDSHEQATAYAEQIDEGKSYAYAAKYAWAYDVLRFGRGLQFTLVRGAVGFSIRKRELSHANAKVYAETYAGARVFYGSRDKAEPYTLAYHYVLGDYSHDYAMAFADCEVRGCSDPEDVRKFAASYAAQREIGKSTPYAHAYALARAADKSPDVAKEEAERFEAAFKGQIAKGSNPVDAYASASADSSTLPYYFNDID